MLAIQVAGGQAGDASNKGSKVSSVFTDSARCGNGHIWGSSPNAFDHDVRKKFSLSVRSVSKIAGNRIRIITAALLKLARYPPNACSLEGRSPRPPCLHPTMNAQVKSDVLPVIDSIDTRNS